MKTRLEFEVETLREMLKASIEALDEAQHVNGGFISKYGQGYRDGRADVLKHIDRILKDVSE